MRSQMPARMLRGSETSYSAICSTQVKYFNKRIFSKGECNGQEKAVYYRIYDDEEKFNYFRSMYQAEKIRKMLKKFEVAHQEYHNAAFVDFLKKYDPKAELIEVVRISY